jgi:transglutaminase-like putative cysteine protease
MSFLFPASAPPASARAQDIYYELANLTYTIHGDRWVEVEGEYTVFNPSPPLWRATIKVTKTIPTTAVENIDIEGVDYTIENTGMNIIIRMSFTVKGQQRHHYRVSYWARDLVAGEGPRYKAKFGRVVDSDFKYENFVVTIQGPKDTVLFLASPEAKKITDTPPTVRYETAVDVGETLDGLSAIFYVRSVYYRLLISQTLSNPTAEDARNVWLDAALFRLTGWQFAALVSSNTPILAMYRDEENNWRATFDVGTLRAGENRDVNIEVVFVCEVYMPGIGAADVGYLHDVPPDMSPYLQEQEYWEVNDPRIQAVAQRFGKNPNTYELAEDIMKFVGNHVELPEEDVDVPRHGALWTYLNRYGDCEGFSDLTIALARAAGLPARLCHGWVFRGDEPGPHAWVEFYLPPKGWMPADPTWAKPVGGYLCSIGSIHVLREVAGLESKTTPVIVWRDGGGVDFGAYDVALTLLTKGEASQEFIKAAELAIQEAERLLGYELTGARSYLNQALATDNIAERTSLAQLALKGAYEVIQERGKPPERRVPIDWQMVLLAALAGGLVAAAASAAFRLRRRK